MWWEGPAVYEIRLSISQYVYENEKPNHSQELLVSGAGSPEVNGNYVFVEYEQ